MHSILACRVSILNQLISLWNFPCILCVCVCVFVCVCVCVCMCFSMLLLMSDYYVPQCVPPWFDPAWVSLNFLDLLDYFLTHDGNFSAIISSNISQVFSLFSFWDHYNVNTGAFADVPKVSRIVFNSSHSFFCILFCSIYFHHCLPGYLSILLF